MKWFLVIVLCIVCMGAFTMLFIRMELTVPAHIQQRFDTATNTQATSTSPTTNDQATPQARIDAKKELIQVSTPIPNAIVHSPLSIKGKARGNWYFEGSFPIVIVDWDGRIIGEGTAAAQGDWMQNGFVPFTATVSFDAASNTPSSVGAVILKKDNPSGLPQNDDSLEIPVSLASTTP